MLSFGSDAESFIQGKWVFHGKDPCEDWDSKDCFNAIPMPALTHFLSLYPQGGFLPLSAQVNNHKSAFSCTTRLFSCCIWTGHVLPPLLLSRCDTASQGGNRRTRIPSRSGGFAPEIQHILLWILLKAEEAAGRVNIRVQSILSARCVSTQMSPVLVPRASTSFFCGKDKACHCNTPFIQVTACVCPCILLFHAERQSCSDLEISAPPAREADGARRVPALWEGTTSAAPETFLHRWKRECSPGLMTGYIIPPWQSVAFCCPDKCQVSINQKNPLPTRTVISSAQHFAVERWMGEMGKLLFRFWAIKWTGLHLTSTPCLWNSILDFAKLIKQHKRGD